MHHHSISSSRDVFGGARSGDFCAFSLPLYPASLLRLSLTKPQKPHLQP